MAAFDTISNEERVAALTVRGILDTPPQLAFDDLAQLAAQVSEAPMASIVFVDQGRQFIKANVGPDKVADALSIVALSTLVVRAGASLVVEDALNDPRFVSEAAASPDGLRFFAGVPLTNPDGHVLGALCVADYKPRSVGLPSEQVEGLRRLARQVMLLMVLSRPDEVRNEAISRKKEELRQAWRLDVVAKASAALLVADDPASVIESILSDGASVLGFDRAYFYDVAPDRMHLRLTHAVNAGPELRQRLKRMPFGQPFSGIVAQTCLPIVVSNLQHDTDPAHAMIRELGLDAFAGFPILSRGELCAVISFASTELSAFDAETLGFFETLARLMSAVYDRLDSEADLAESGAYWRSLFERLSEGFVLGEAIRDETNRVVDWRLVEVNHAWGGLMGRDVHQSIGQTFLQLFPDSGEGWLNDVAAVVETGEPITYLRQISLIGRWFEGSVFAVGTDRFAMTVLDVTDRVRVDEERQLLAEEMSHRLKNTLAMVLSIATQTLRSVSDRAPVESFEKRIHALSSAHDVLLRQSWTAAPMSDVIKSVVARVGHGDRFDLAGPDVDLGPRAALSVSLLVHELATNAAKYGALSVPTGRVAVDWRFEQDDDIPGVAFEWVERGGPKVTQPTEQHRRGFGMRLIGLGLAGSGKVDLRYLPSGFQASMWAKFAELQQS